MLTEGTNIWGMAPRQAGEFYQLPEAEPSLLDQLGGGGGGGGMSFRMAPQSPLFAPGTLLNWGNGPVDPATFLDQINADRGKLISKDASGKFVLQPSTGVPAAQDAYKAAVASGTNWDKPRGYTADELARYTANAKAHTDTQGTIMNWPQKPVSSPTLGQQQALRNMTPVSTAGQGLPWQIKK